MTGFSQSGSKETLQTVEWVLTDNSGPLQTILGLYTLPEVHKGMYNPQEDQLYLEFYHFTVKCLYRKMAFPFISMGLPISVYAPLRALGLEMACLS